MLRKLLKHEFRATGRIMLPLYLVLLVTAVAANLATRGLMETPYWFFDMVGGLLVVAFVIAIIGVFVVAFVLMIQRFYKNLLQDEGYVMLTLPVSIHQHIWSKMIVSSVWYILTVLAVILAGCIMAFNVGVVKDILWGLGEIFQELRKVQAYYAINGTVILAELALLAFLSLVSMCLQFYAALAAGHSFPNHKMAWSVVWYFGLQFVSQILSFSAINLLDQMAFFEWGIFYLGIKPDVMAGIHIGLLLMLVYVVAYGAVFYAITTFFLKKRLNLE